MQAAKSCLQSSVLIFRLQNRRPYPVLLVGQEAHWSRNAGGAETRHTWPGETNEDVRTIDHVM